MRRNPIAKYSRYLAKVKVLLEGTLREDYSREQDYKRVVTLRKNKIKQLEMMIERLKSKRD